MFKKNKIKNLFCIFMTFLMVFTIADTGILGVKQVFAETVKEESKVTKNEEAVDQKVKPDDEDKKLQNDDKIVVDESEDSQNNDEKVVDESEDSQNNDEIAVDENKNSQNSDEAVVDESEKSTASGKNVEGKEINLADENEKIDEIGSDSSIKIVNDFTKVKVGDKIEIKVQNDKEQEVPVKNLTFTVSDKKIGRMDKRIQNKFITLGSGTVVIKAALKDKPNISNEAEFKIDENSREVYIRIEGYDHTVIPRTKVKISLEALPKIGKADKFRNPTHAHAIVKTLLDNQFEIGDGNKKGYFKFTVPFYLSGLDGDSEFNQGTHSGWMYRVNGKLPNVGAQGRELKDGDDIIWFYGAFGFLTKFTQINVDKKQVLENEPIVLTATGEETDINTYEKRQAPLNNATVVITKIIDGKEEVYNELGNIKTDKDGKATLNFKEAGQYKLSLIRYGSDNTTDGDKIDIVRPVPITITVEDKSKEKEKLKKQVEEAIDSASKIVVDNHFSGDWAAIGLARAGNADKISKDYLKNTAKYLETPSNQETFKNKPTEFERITLGVLAAGGDPTDIGEINLIKQIYTVDLGSQGINALDFGLIALDAGEYYVPSDVRWTREKIIDAILGWECQNKKNDYKKPAGWAWGSRKDADPDMTAMTMTALAPYNNAEHPKVQEAIKRAVDWLKFAQIVDTGGYYSWGAENSESCAQVIMGLCANGIDPVEDFTTKNGGNVVKALLSFKTEDGGFCHTKYNEDYGYGGDTNGMATEQALYALDQYIYFVEEKGSIYQWGKQETIGDKTVNIRIEDKDNVIVPNTDVIVKGNNPTVKDAVKKVLQLKKMSFEEDSTGFSVINNKTADKDNNEKWLCSIENGLTINDMSSRYINNYENIIVYLGKDSKEFSYTWIECKDALLFKPQEIQVFTGLDVELIAKGYCDDNKIKDISDAEVYVNGKTYKKDDKNIFTDKSGKFVVNFDKSGNYEVIIKKDNIRTANFLVKAVDDIEPPEIYFSAQIEDKIDKDKIEEFWIRPSDNKDPGKDIDMIVKLNGSLLQPTEIRDFDGGRKFENELFNKYDNYLEITVTDKSGNTQTITRHVINTTKSIEVEKKLMGAVDEAIDSASNRIIESKYKWGIVFPLSVAGKTNKISDKILEDYMKVIANYIDEVYDTSIQDARTYSEIVLELLACEKNPKNFADTNIIKNIYNSSDYLHIGIMARMLIALDAGQYKEIEEATWTRKELINKILEQFKDFKDMDTDDIGLVLTALAPYTKNSYSKVNKAVRKAVEYLSKIQEKDGRFATWGKVNSITCAEVISGLCSNGIDPTSIAFTKNNINVVQALLSFKCEDGGFTHRTDVSMKSNEVATVTAICALAQYKNFVEKKGSIYSFGDKNSDSEAVKSLRVRRVELGSKSITVKEGQEVQLEAKVIPKDALNKKLIWKSNDDNVAEVDENGLVTGIKEGNVQITVTSEEGQKTAKCSIQVIKEIVKDNLKEEVEGAIQSAGDVVSQNNNSMDWAVIGLARGKQAWKIDNGRYYENLENYLKNNNGEFPNKPTEYERMTLGILATGGDPTDIAGYNLIKKIYNADLDNQGINAFAFGLIALDAGEYKVPKDAKWNRAKIIDAILELECQNKENDYKKQAGWAWGSKSADPDMTGMAMTALAPYNNDKYPKVQEAVKRAVDWLKFAQIDTGGYKSWRTENSESCAQVIMGLCTNKIDPAGKDFIKENGGNVVSALLSFKTEDGGFCHIKCNGDYGGDTNGMATEQALYALDQYIYFLDKKGSIYHWGDMNPEEPQKPEEFIVKRIGEESLKKGSSVEVEFSIENILKEDKEVTLATVLYDKNTNQMLNYSYVKKTLKAEEKEIFAGGFTIPQEGDYVVKAIICDDLAPNKMNVLADPVTIGVE